MAIVFTSPVKKQRIFFWSIFSCIVLFLFIVSLIVFPPAFKSALKDAPTEDSPITINFNVLDSDAIKNLEPFLMLQADKSSMNIGRNNPFVSY